MYTHSYYQYTVSHEPQCADFRRVLTCSYNTYKTMHYVQFRPLNLNVVLRQ